MDQIEAGKLIDTFTEDLKLSRKSPDTIRNYPNIVRAFCKFVNGDLLVITKDTLREYLGTMITRNLKHASIERNFTVLSEFYEFLIYSDLYTLANPVTAFRKRYLRVYKAGSEAGVRKSPSTSEVIKLVNGIYNTRDLAVVVLLFKTGMRRKELSELDISDVDMTTRTITLKPTAKRTNRTVFFDEECAYVLGRWLKRRENINKHGNPALFISQFGDRLKPHAIGELFMKYAKKVGLYGNTIETKITPHCARHWFTTELIEAGMMFEHVQHLRGDKGQESANRYHHIKEAELREEYEKCMPVFGI
jgi:integrase/recombinase XerD